MTPRRIAAWRCLRAMLASLLLTLPALAAQAQTRGIKPADAPMEAPFLRLDAGFHTQVVNRFTLDRDGLIVATASDDKTLRLWRAADGQALATLRVPLAEGAEGALYAAALSPDGRTLLAGGFTGYAWDHAFALYVFDVETQRLRGRLPNLPAPINHIAYAPDGARIAVALGGTAGIRVIDAATGTLVFADAEYAQRATWVTFDAHGRLAAASLDGEVRLYDPAGRRLARRAPAPGAHPYAVAFSPDGTRLAVGDADRPRVDVLDAATLAPRATLASPGAGSQGSGGLGAVAWGPDGSLLAAGSLRGAGGGVVLRRWAGGAGAPADVPAANDTIFQIAALADGGVMLAGAGPILARLDPRGRTVFRLASPGLDFRDVADRLFRVSDDGMAVEFQTRAMAAPWRIDMAARSITALAPTRGISPVPPPQATLAPRVTHWRNLPAPEVDGHVIGLDPQELARAFAVSPRQDIILFGTDYAMRAVRRDGRPAGTAALPAAAWAVGMSSDGRVAVAALGDGTLRWFGLSPEGELTPRIALFPAADGRRWVAWTDGGFFDQSDQGGEQLAGMVLPRGRAQAPDWFSFAQVFRLFYAPDTLAARLRGQDATGAPPGVAGLRALLAATPPPRIDLAAVCWPQDGATSCTAMQPPTARGVAAQPATLDVPQAAASIDLRYSLAAAPGVVPGLVDVFVNGRNAGRIDASAAGNGVASAIPLDPGANRIQLRAYDSAGLAYASSALVRVTRAAPAAAARPTLHLLAVGIDHYRPAINSLNFAVADARAVAAAIRAHPPGAYAAVQATELYDEAASAPAILAALDAIAARAQPGDTVILYLSGHGVQIDGRYYFVTQNVAAIDAIATTALAETSLVKALASVRARNGLLLLDTRYAGAFSLDSASQIAHESGRYVLAASASAEEALDSYDNRNGVFATAVLRGLSGQGGTDAQGVVDNFRLGLFVTPLVRQLATERHHSQNAKFKIEAEDATPFPITQPRQH